MPCGWYTRKIATLSVSGAPPSSTRTEAGNQDGGDLQPSRFGVYDPQPMLEEFMNRPSLAAAVSTLALLWAVAPAVAQDAQSLVRLADSAMYAGKKDGKRTLRRTRGINDRAGEEAAA